MNNSFMNFDLPEVKFALETICRAATLSSQIQKEDAVKTFIKNDLSPVTLADMGIQAICGGLLKRYLPQDVLIGEETSKYLRARENQNDLNFLVSKLKNIFPDISASLLCDFIDVGTSRPQKSFWTIDPIDGTKGFIRHAQYATALAKIEKGEVVLAALGCPELILETTGNGKKGVGVLAVRGKGCWAFPFEDAGNGDVWRRLNVSKQDNIHSARIVDSFEMSRKKDERVAFIHKELGDESVSIEMDSLAKQAVIACGEADVFYRLFPRKNLSHREKIWDVAAGVLIVEEAGGKVTDLKGQKLDFGQGEELACNIGVLATNGVLHSAMRAILKKGNIYGEN